jgi:hypothetical protein
MEKYLDNVQLYCNSYLTEYKLVLETHHKEVLDEVKSKNIVNKTFKLYNLQKIVPYFFMYDYGTWIFLTSLSTSRGIIKYGDKIYNQDWCNIHVDEDRRREILRELKITEKDVIDTVRVEGCDFLNTHYEKSDIINTAKYHARNKTKTEVMHYSYRNRPKTIVIKDAVISLLSKKNIIIIFLLALCFIAGFFLGNIQRLKYTKKINFFGFEIEISDKYFEDNNIKNKSQKISGDVQLDKNHDASQVTADFDKMNNNTKQ